MFFSSTGACTATKSPIVNHRRSIVAHLYFASVTQMFLMPLFVKVESDSSKLLRTVSKSGPNGCKERVRPQKMNNNFDHWSLFGTLLGTKIESFHQKIASQWDIGHITLSLYIICIMKISWMTMIILLWYYKPNVAYWDYLYLPCLNISIYRDFVRATLIPGKMVVVCHNMYVCHIKHHSTIAPWNITGKVAFTPYLWFSMISTKLKFYL